MALRFSHQSIRKGSPEGAAASAVINELKGRGYSMARIATELNKQRVATPRGGRWDHLSVRNVLQRLQRIA